MATAVTVRADFSTDELRRLAAASKHANQSRRLLSLAAVLDGMSRADAARIGGMDRQTLRDWVHRFNERGPEGLKDSWSKGHRPRLSAEQLAQLAEVVETGPERAVHGIVRWRRVDLQQIVAERFGVAYHERTIGKILKQLGFSHVSARPRHPAKDEGMLRVLAAWLGGDRQVCSMVRVPTPEEEDGKRPHRERERLVQEKLRIENRIEGLLFTQGIRARPSLRSWERELTELRTGDGRTLPPLLRAELDRLRRRLVLILELIRELEAERAAALAAAPDEAMAQKITSLQRVRGIGANFSAVLVREVLYRSFANRRQPVGALGTFSTSSTSSISEARSSRCLILT